MAEQIDLTQPYQPDPRQATAFTVERIDLNWGAQSIGIEIEDAASGVRRVIHYEGETAVQLMIGLNKANLSTKSLHRRVLERLLADGHLAGTISGTPD